MKLRTVLLLPILLSGCATSSSSDQREAIIAALEQLNAAENQSLEIGLEKKIADIDATMADDWEGWSNGVHASSRTAERQTERVLFTVFPNYQRSFDLIVVEPPYANVLWSISGTAATNGYELRMVGATTFEFNAAGRITRSWLHSGQTPAPTDIGLESDDT